MDWSRSTATGFGTTPEFQAAYRRGLRAADGVDPGFAWRVHVALWAAKTALHVSGDFVECGVNAGFVSSAIMQALDWNATGRRFFLVDTWAGPPLDQYDASEVAAGRRQVAQAAMAAGAYVADIERVRRNFAEWPGAVIVQGAVPDVLPQIPSAQIAFLHLDMNAARPEQAALAYLWPRLPPGAVVLLDDYAYHGFEEQARAIDAVAEQVGASVLALPTGQGLIVK